jgi:hypothetical protein
MRALSEPRASGECFDFKNRDSNSIPANFKPFVMRRIHSQRGLNDAYPMKYILHAAWPHAFAAPVSRSLA